jgi:hypothetical protein
MRKLWLLAIAVQLCTACGSDTDNPPTSSINPDAVFVASHNIQLSAAIDPATMTQLATSSFGTDPFAFPTEESYIIATQNDLDLFNQPLPLAWQLTLTDLDLHSYVLISSPSCPSWFELAGAQSNGEATDDFTLTVNQFTLTDAACAAVIEKFYAVFQVDKL